MEILGIGPLELMMILVIILLVAGPRDIARMARNLGRLLNRMYRSPSYQAIRRASQELRNLPERLAREAQLEELEELKEVKQELDDLNKTIGGVASAKPFQAWVRDLDAAAQPNPPTGNTPTAAQPPAAANNGPAPAEQPPAAPPPAPEPPAVAPPSTPQDKDA